MIVCSKCVECELFLTCKDDDRCKHESEYTRRDVSWRELSHTDAILDEVDYGSIILALHHESNRDKNTLMKVAKDIIDQRLQDFWYLVNLNADQLINEAEGGERDEEH